MHTVSKNLRTCTCYPPAWQVGSFFETLIFLLLLLVRLLKVRVWDFVERTAPWGCPAMGCRATPAWVFGALGFTFILVVVHIAVVWRPVYWWEKTCTCGYVKTLSNNILVIRHHAQESIADLSDSSSLSFSLFLLLNGQLLEDVLLCVVDPHLHCFLSSDLGSSLQLP